MYGQAERRTRFGIGPDNPVVSITENLRALDEIGKAIHRKDAMRVIVIIHSQVT